MLPATQDTMQHAPVSFCRIVPLIFLAMSGSADDASGWIDSAPHSTGGLGHHLITLTLLAAATAACYYGAPSYVSRLYGRWQGGCTPQVGGASPDRQRSLRRRLLPTTMALRVKRVQGSTTTVRANQDDTVDELIARIEERLAAEGEQGGGGATRVRNLLYAGEILTPFGGSTLRQMSVEADATLVFTPEARPEVLQSEGGWLGWLHRLIPSRGTEAARRRQIQEPSAPPTLLARVAGPSVPASGPPRPRPTRCHHCNEKLTPMATALECRCGGYYCDAHRPTRAHECAFDAHRAARTRIRSSLKESLYAGPALIDATQSGRYADLYEAEHPCGGAGGLGRAVRLAHNVGFCLVCGSTVAGLCYTSPSPMLQGWLVSLLLVKGVHAWMQWALEGTVTCSCHYCIWSVEGCRNPSLAWACEWCGFVSCFSSCFFTCNRACLDCTSARHTDRVCGSRCHRCSSCAGRAQRRWCVG
jgi:hypothetical protein